jgi:uncharacterized membrane protein
VSHDWALYFCLFLALWSAMIGGAFSAFSEFIMAALLGAAPASGIESMQQINRAVLASPFVAGMLSIAVFSVLFAVYGLFALEGAALVTLVLAPFVYLPTVVLMTRFGNVPMNRALDDLDPYAAESEAYWRTYGRRWTRRNHVRALGSVLTAGLYVIAAVTLMTSGQV